MQTVKSSEVYTCCWLTSPRLYGFASSGNYLLYQHNNNKMANDVTSGNCCYDQLVKSALVLCNIKMFKKILISCEVPSENKYSMCAHTGAPKQFFVIFAKRTVRILIYVDVYHIPNKFIVFLNLISILYCSIYLLIDIFVPLGDGPRCTNHVPKAGPCCLYTGAIKEKPQINNFQQY